MLFFIYRLHMKIELGYQNKKKLIKEKVADHEFKDFHSKKIVRHLYDGDKPPWEFSTKIMCWSDIYRIEANLLIDKANQIDSKECYQDAVE